MVTNFLYCITLWEFLQYLLILQYVEYWILGLCNGICWISENFMKNKKTR